MEITGWRYTVVGIDGCWWTRTITKKQNGISAARKDNYGKT